MKTKYTLVFTLQRKELVLVPIIEVLKKAGHHVLLNQMDKSVHSYILFLDESVEYVENNKRTLIQSAAFDVYGTLLGQYSKEMVTLLKYMKACGITILVWTNSTEKTAKNAAIHLKIGDYVDDYSEKFKYDLPDIAFDDDPEQSVLAKLATICIT